MDRVPNTSWFIDGVKAIKLCDPTVFKEATTILPMDRIQNFFYNKELEPGEEIACKIEFLGDACEFKIKKLRSKDQKNPSTSLNWKGTKVDNYLKKLEVKNEYNYREVKGDIDIKKYTRMEFIKNKDTGTINLEIKNCNLDEYEFIYKLDINYSLLNNKSFIIPQEYHAKFLKCIPQKHIERSQSYDIKLLVEDKEFQATISNVNRYVKSDTIRIVFRKDLSEFLKGRLSHSDNIVKQYSKELTGESIDFYLTGKETEFFMKLNVYKENNINDLEKESVEETGESYMETKNIIEYIQEYIQKQGYTYTQEQLSNLFLSLKTKPFVILAGISGTGKSKIVRLFADSIGATTENKQFNMISVRPDWNDSTELIGYKNLNDEFIDGSLIKIVKEALKPENKNKPYFICLDEMNLARVEYYLSDYLSIIESRKKVGQDIITDSEIKIPDNIYLIGTVNMDDTTFTFSRKVLDRANTIEFSDVDLESLFTDDNEEYIEPLNINNSFLKTTYLKTIDIEEDYREYAKEINNKIIDINNILKQSQKQFAYRVRDEILFYMIENKKADLLNEDIAFDYQIMQKILPAITGSEQAIAKVLIDLFNFVCESNVIDSIDIEEAENYIENARYKKSAEKIVYMLKGYQNDGYVSYWY